MHSHFPENKLILAFELGQQAEIYIFARVVAFRIVNPDGQVQEADNTLFLREIAETNP